MFIVKMYGGLGNQMFIYAFAYFLKKNGHKVAIDTTEINYNSKFYFQTKEQSNKIAIRNLDIKKFCLDKQISFFYKRYPSFFPYPTILHTLFQKSKFNMMGKYITSNNDKLKNKKYLDTLPNETYFDNHWLDLFYINSIQEDLPSLFSPLEPIQQATILEDIRKSKNACFIHIRREDYLSQKNWFFSKLGLAYYISAMNFMVERLGNIKFFVFSDDINWIQQEFYKKILPYFKGDMSNIVIASTKKNTNIDDLELMRNCQHAIIANSTFSWWGAYLISNPNKIVTAPQTFHNNPQEDVASIIIPNNWITIDNIWGTIL